MKDNKYLEQNARKGKKLTVWGFLFAIMGIIAYCLTGFFYGIELSLNEMLDKGPVLFTLSFCSIAFGLILWLIGQYIYLNAIINESFNKK